MMVSFFFFFYLFIGEDLRPFLVSDFQSRRLFREREREGIERSCGIKEKRKVELMNSCRTRSLVQDPTGYRNTRLPRGKRNRIGPSYTSPTRCE